MSYKKREVPLPQPNATRDTLRCLCSIRLHQIS
jgi:hypothetical protein